MLSKNLKSSAGKWLYVVEQGSPDNSWCMLWLIARVAFDAYFNNGEFSRHMLCVDWNNSKDHPPLCQHICLMSKQSGWLPSAKKLLKIFSQKLSGNHKASPTHWRQAYWVT